MAMGIVSDDDFDKELAKANPTPREVSKDSPITGEVVDMPAKGRGVGNVEVPDSLRKVIGETSITEGRDQAVELARQFGISPSSVSAYNVGAKSTATYDETPNLPNINKAKERIGKRAGTKLMAAMRHITDEKLGEAKVRDLASIAKDMSVVFKHMEPDGPKTPANTGPTFVFYSPQFRKEEHYDVVQAKE